MKDLLLTIGILIVLDAIVLNMLSGFFNKQIKQVQGLPIKMDIVATFLCYVFLVILLYYFIILKKRPVYEAFLLGLLTYGIYELTTKGLLINWNWSTVLVDSLWGGILFALTTYLVYHFV